MNRRPLSTAGFTLVEILIVVLLMSIVAVAMMPDATPSVYDELTGVARILSADLAYGRSLAVLNDDRYQFQFDLQNNCYTLSYSGADPTLAALPPSPFQSSQDPSSQYVVRLANLPRLGIPVTLFDVQALTPEPVEATTIEFTALGATTQTQPITIWLAAGQGSAERYIFVSINPFNRIGDRRQLSSRPAPHRIRHQRRCHDVIPTEFPAMISRLKSRQPGPIGLDIGSHCVKLIQFSADHSRVIDAARWELPDGETMSAAERWPQVAAAVRQAREGRHFRGRETVIGFGAPELTVQNVRVAKAPGGELDKIVRQEAAGRLPYPVEEAEIRFIEAADVRQGETTKREVILLTCRKTTLIDALSAIEETGLRIAAVDVEPAALLRCYAKQFRRDEDRQQRSLFVHLGAATAVALIAKGTDVLFIKYIDVGGRHLDDAVARALDMTRSEAATLRRHNGDRRADQQDPEITRSVAEATRPVVERLAGELALCTRYHSVTFRGQPLARVVISGGEATPALGELIGIRLDLKWELGDPLRTYEIAVQAGRKGQWDVATGLALRTVEND